MLFSRSITEVKLAIQEHRGELPKTTAHSQQLSRQQASMQRAAACALRCMESEVWERTSGRRSKAVV